MPRKNKSEEDSITKNEETKTKTIKTSETLFAEKVTELKKTKSETELLEIVSIQPANHELRDFMAARKALDELGIKYSMSFE